MISVVMPVYNGAQFLDESLASIQDQHCDDLEVLLVDDGSSDGLPARAVSLPPFVRFFRQANQGPAAARNRGIQAARGELIAFLDVDDRWTPGHLDRLERVLAENSQAGIAQGRMQHFAVTENGLEHRSGPYRMPYLGSCLFRRWVFDRCGLFDERMRFGEDYDLMFRCWEQDVVKHHVSEVSLLYRRHAGNMTRDDDMRSHLVILKRRSERLRSGQVDPKESRRVAFQDYIGEIEDARQWHRWSA